MCFKHSLSIVSLALISLGWTTGAMAAEEAPPARNQLISAVEKSLPVIEISGVAWWENRKCLSCHTVTFTIWAHQAAQHAGLTVDREKLDLWKAWQVEELAKPNPGLETFGQILLTTLYDPQPSPELWEKVPPMLLKMQEANGSWKAGGQLPRQNRPAAESNEVSAWWSLLALASTPDGRQQSATALEKTRDWLKTAQEPTTVETLIVRALAQQRFAPESDGKPAVQKLLSHQLPDGGWGWKLTDTHSNPLSTGQVLYALSQLAPNSPAIAPAQRWLLSAQQADGSWPTDGAIFSSRPPAQHARIAPIYLHWGTAWATLGLLHTLPPGH